jgi:hypothetical protein
MVIGVFIVVAGVAGWAWQNAAHAASCEAILGKWAWFIGGEVTVNRDGTFTQQSGNAGTWECNDGARGRFTFRWRDGGFVNSLVVSPDGQGLTSTDQSQWYVTAQRSAPALPPPLARQEDCCQEAYGCETQRIDAEFAQKTAQCRGNPGNAACFREAVSTKAAQLQAAGAKLRLCNRAASGEVIGPVPGSGGPVSLPGSSDEFHSTDRPGFFSPECVCTAVQDPEQTASGGGDTFGSNTPGPDSGQPPRRPPPDQSPPSNPPDGPLPWEQPAHAQTPRRVGTVTATLRWEEITEEFGQKIQRRGNCHFAIEFYEGGKALARESKYLNEDRTAPFPPRIDVEKIEGDRSRPSGLYTSNLQRVRRANGNYDISWTNPFIDAVQSWYREYPKGSNVRQPPQTGGSQPSTHKVTRCIGRVGNALATAYLPNVPLKGSTPKDLSTEALTIIRDDVEKQAPHLTIHMHWEFELPRGSLLNRTRGQ